MSFSAEATTRLGEITDARDWRRITYLHDYNAVHTYEELESACSTVNDIDLETESTIRIRAASAHISVDPTRIESRFDGENCHRAFEPQPGTGYLNYTVEVDWVSRQIRLTMIICHTLGHSVSAVLTDTDIFGWIAIIMMVLPSNGRYRGQRNCGRLADEDSITVELPFEFPFYGEMKTEVCISSNGYLTFGSEGKKWKNTPIPDPSEPNDLLAVVWDDLNPGRQKNIFYWGNEHEFVVQYEGVPKRGARSELTFQVVLTPMGTIRYRYSNMDCARLNEATIGIENSRAPTDCRSCSKKITSTAIWKFCSSRAG